MHCKSYDKDKAVWLLNSNANGFSRQQQHGSQPVRLDKRSKSVFSLQKSDLHCLIILHFSCSLPIHTSAFLYFLTASSSSVQHVMDLLLCSLDSMKRQTVWLYYHCAILLCSYCIPKMLITCYTPCTPYIL